MGVRPSMRVLYLLPGFSLGGAELGLLTLIDGGLFKDMNLEVVGISGAGSGLIPELKARGVSHRALSSDKKRSLLQIAQAGLSLRRLIKDFKPDVLLMSLPLANIVGRLFSIGAGTSARISFEHSIAYDRLSYGPILRLLSFRVDAVMADSQTTLDSVRRFLGGGRNMPEWVVPLLSFASDKQRKTEYTLRIPVRVLCVGRLSPEKNHACALKAFALLRSRGWDIQGIIVGNGPEMDRLQKMAGDLGLANFVCFRGWQMDWDEEAFSSDVFLSTSLREGLCLAVAEAMSFGLPVVSTNVGGIREYACTNRNIVFVEENEPKDIADALERLLCDGSLRRRLGCQAAIDMQKAYGAENVRVRFNEIRGEILSYVRSREEVE